jgi:hypothetical protein
MLFQETGSRDRYFLQVKIKSVPVFTGTYSLLNPETSTDSPLAKSKRVRLVSAKQEINHTHTKGKNKFNF